MLKRRCERGKWPGILKPLLKRCNGRAAGTRQPRSRLSVIYAIRVRRRRRYRHYGPSRTADRYRRVTERLLNLRVIRIGPVE